MTREEYVKNTLEHCDSEVEEMIVAYLRHPDRSWSGDWQTHHDQIAEHIGQGGARVLRLCRGLAFCGILRESTGWNFRINHQE